MSDKSKKSKFSPGWYLNSLSLEKGEELVLDYRGFSESDARKSKNQIRILLEKVVHDTQPLLDPISPDEFSKVLSFDVPVSHCCIPRFAAAVALGFEITLGKCTLTGDDLETVSQFLREGYAKKTAQYANLEWAQGTQEKKKEQPTRDSASALSKLKESLHNLECSVSKTRKKTVPMADIKKQFNDLKDKIQIELSCALHRAERCREDMDYEKVRMELKDEEKRCLVYLHLRNILQDMRRYVWNKHCFEGAHVRGLFPETVLGMKEIGIKVSPTQMTLFSLTPKSPAVPISKKGKLKDTRAEHNSSARKATLSENSGTSESSPSTIKTNKKDMPSPRSTASDSIFNESFTSHDEEVRCALCITTFCKEDHYHAQEDCPHDHQGADSDKAQLVTTYRCPELLAIFNRVVDPNKPCEGCEPTYLNRRGVKNCTADLYNLKPCTKHRKEIISTNRFKKLSYNLHNCPLEYLIMDSSTCESCEPCQNLSAKVFGKKKGLQAMKEKMAGLMRHNKASTPQRSHLKKARANDSVVIAEEPKLESNQDHKPSAPALDTVSEAASTLPSSTLLAQQTNVEQPSQPAENQTLTPNRVNKTPTASEIAQEVLDGIDRRVNGSILDSTYKSVNSHFQKTQPNLDEQIQDSGGDDEEEGRENIDREEDEQGINEEPPPPAPGGGGPGGDPDDDPDPNGGGGGPGGGRRRRRRDSEEGDEPRRPDQRRRRRRHDGDDSPNPSQHDSDSSDSELERRSSKKTEISVVQQPLLHLKSDGCPIFSGNLYLYPEWRKYVNAVISSNGTRVPNIRLHHQILEVLDGEAKRLVAPIDMDHKKSAYEVLDVLERHFDRPWLLWELEIAKLRELALPIFFMKDSRGIEDTKLFVAQLKKMKKISDSSATHLDIETSLRYLLTKLHPKFKIQWMDKCETMAASHQEVYAALPLQIRRQNLKYPKERLVALIYVIDRQIERCSELVDVSIGGCLNEEEIAKSAREALHQAQMIGRKQVKSNQPVRIVNKNQGTNPRNAFSTQLTHPLRRSAIPQPHSQSYVNNPQTMYTNTNPRVGFSQPGATSKPENSGREMEKNCQFCGKRGDHYLFQCKNPLRKGPNELLRIAVRNQKCLNCLGVNRHRAYECRREPCGVSGCVQRHNKLLHGADFKNLRDIIVSEINRASKYGGPLQTGNGSHFNSAKNATPNSQAQRQLPTTRAANKTELPPSQQMSTNRAYNQKSRSKSRPRGKAAKPRPKSKPRGGRGYSRAAAGEAQDYQNPSHQPRRQSSHPSSRSLGQGP